MPIAITSAAGVSLGNGTAVVCGGNTNGGCPVIKECNVYDAIANTWTAAKPMADARADYGMVKVGGVLVQREQNNCCGAQIAS